MNHLRAVPYSIITLIIIMSLISCDLFGSPTQDPTGGISTLTPNTLNLSSPINQSTTDSFSFTNTSSSSASYSISSSQSWLVLTPTSGTVAAGASETISVNASCTNATETRTGIVTLRSGSTSRTLTAKLACTSNNPSTNGAFNISLEFSGEGITDSRKAVFERAAARWAEVIIGDITDITDIPEGAVTSNTVCGHSNTVSTTQIDDLLIYARIAPIDGAGKILGQAGPSVFRVQGEDKGKTLIGCMEFDSDDILGLEGSGAFENVIKHEMGHVLGIGTTWNLSDNQGNKIFELLEFDTNDNSCSTASTFSSKPVFVGTNALAEYATLGKSGNIPVEDEFGQGTQCGHWDEGAFDHELMTGFAEKEGDMPLSRLTIASLKDMGYDVSFATAEPYLIPNCFPNCARLLAPESNELWEVVLPPRGFINLEGEITWFAD